MKATRRPARNNDLARIHIAKKDLGMDDDTYRDMLWTVRRVRSARDLDEAGRREVLEHLIARGWKPKVNKARRKQYPGRPHNTDNSRQLLKVEALLTDARRPWAYADAMAQRMFQVERVAWLNPDQLRSLIAALEYDRRRHER